METEAMCSKYDAQVIEYIDANMTRPEEHQHTLIINHVFEIIAEAQPKPSAKEVSKFFHGLIITEDKDGNIIQHAIKGFTDHVNESAIKIDGTYSLSGRLLGYNSQSPALFFYDNSHSLICRTPVHLESDMINKVHTSGLGIVVKIIREDPNDFLNATIILIKHTDYDRVNNCSVSFLVQYVQPGLESMLKPSLWAIPGNQVLINGHIVGHDPLMKVWKIRCYENVRHFHGTKGNGIKKALKRNCPDWSLARL
ncbi:uncharacterized protein MELLADRAFT_104576 [Melampsora larici-populina 98AG31]|uniref:Uncharacterized protein n=1 Tax=Melampsora larici-populina (strain 98AG31 / pathotype 3-4-7) TaxID=747676 RepID=F4RF69_MELLP|nr:uncharacterized protein MELLADRAFT_104576 [Melampsora larici-populina 98AG31]EGG08761.1 hypothetical protein MELLADRAFT_104576 [Melampsora larici-populina 98AG31]